MSETNGTGRGQDFDAGQIRLRMSLGQFATLCSLLLLAAGCWWRTESRITELTVSLKAMVSADEFIRWETALRASNTNLVVPAFINIKRTQMGAY